MRLTPQAREILEKRYLEPGQSIEEKFRQVATTLASPEESDSMRRELEEEAYGLMTSLKFLPNSPTISNAGRGAGSLSACFVVPIEDSRESIFESLKMAAHIQAHGGGVGFDFSDLRPKGAPVRTTNRPSTGPLTFLGIYSVAIKGLTQAGIRDGANMGIMSVSHPDILGFIDYKRSTETIATNFNLSISITDAFMQAVEADADWTLEFPGFPQCTKTVKAREIWTKLISGAWENGEPGTIFIDTINNKRCPEDRALGLIKATNPCGESPILPWESCNLGSINLTKFVRKGRLDKRSLHKVVTTAIRILDNVIDANTFPCKQIDKMTKTTRRIGLGVAGFADYLILRGIDYRSNAAVEEAKNVMATIHFTSIKTSEQLAIEKGPCPAMAGRKATSTPRRNITVNAIAPTGTISRIMGCSAGIEPIFALKSKKQMLGKVYEVSHPLFDEFVEAGKPTPLFITSNQVSMRQHVLIQTAFQKYVDNAVSKTIVCPFETTKEEVEQAFWLAYKNGCKGITVYRENSRWSQGESAISEAAIVVPSIVPKRPRILLGFNERVPTAKGNMYININFHLPPTDVEKLLGIFKHYPAIETFIWLGKSGAEDHANTEAIGRIASRHLRRGLPAAELIKDLMGIGADDSSSWDPEMKRIRSIPDCLARVLKSHLPIDQTISVDGKTCKLCGGEMHNQEGCISCVICGASEKCN